MATLSYAIKQRRRREFKSSLVFLNSEFLTNVLPSLHAVFGTLSKLLAPRLAALRLRQGCLINKKLLSEAIMLVVIRMNFDSSFSKHDRFCGGPGSLNVGGPGALNVGVPGGRAPSAPSLIRP